MKILSKIKSLFTRKKAVYKTSKKTANEGIKDDELNVFLKTREDYFIKNRSDNSDRAQL